MTKLLGSILLIGIVGASLCQGETRPAEKTAAERGREALLGRSFSPPFLTLKDYNNLWKQWGLTERPADYQQALNERYGLHPACYDNQGRPMGLREAPSLLGKGIGNDCMLCHAGRIAGQTYFGLGNASLDLQGLFDDVAAANGLKQAGPFQFSNVRGTIEATATTIFLMQFRDADLNVREPVKLDFRDDVCEDVPAWWLMKKKQTMYHTGAGNARSVRTLMAFMLSPLNSGEYIKRQEATFRDIQAYLLTLEAPKYPFAVNEHVAARGKELFVQTCSRCHGTYGPGGTYPNRIVPIETIGTDPTLATGQSRTNGDFFNQSWFAQEKGQDGKSYKGVETGGYQAPPLDGVWATAPYFHNGSAPTLYHVLNSKARPKIFTRTYRTEKEDYDTVKVGLKITVLDRPPAPGLAPRERRKVYDTTQPGRANSGHTFGDKLTDAERMAVIEYLKTLQGDLADWPMSIKYAILGLLSDRALHGYELKAAYEEELVPATQLNYGQVYTTLERLARDGLVAHEVVSQTERPDKKVYALTTAGRAELDQWLKTPARLDLDLRNETFMKLVLARRLRQINPLEVLAIERRSCFERLHEVAQTRARADKEKAPLQTVLLLDLAVLKLEAFLKWLDRCEEALRREKTQ